MTDHVLTLQRLQSRLSVSEDLSWAERYALDAAIAALRAQPSEPQGERRAPVQRYYGKTIPWRVHGLAWEAYAKKYGSSQSAERIAERGGFGIGEMDEFLPGWRDMAENTAPAGNSGGEVKKIFSAGRWVYEDSLYSVEFDSTELDATAHAAYATPQPDEPVADMLLYEISPGVYEHIREDAAHMFRSGQLIRVRSVAAPVAQSREVESGEVCRYFASGPEGSFFTQSLADAQNLLDVACFDSDEWTVTDLLAPSQEKAS